MFSILTLFSDPLTFMVGFIALAVSIGVHEFSHVLSAYVQGDTTGKMMGRLTLNPLKHLDPVGTIAIVVAGIGWGRPAPYNPYNLRFRRWGPLLVALGGPVSNVVLATIFGYLLLLIGGRLPAGNLLLTFLQTMVVLNAGLAVFNLIPIAPLDGSHMLSALLGPDNALVRTLQRYGMWLLIAMLVVGGGLLSMYILGGVRLLLRLVGLGVLV